MITFLDDYRKSAPTLRRPRTTYLDPTSQAEAALAERWATAERLMRLFKLNWSQAIAMARRLGEPQASEPVVDDADPAVDADAQTLPTCSGVLSGR
jgi:hypothetical protein